jgi:hypothetical protein
VGHRRAPGGSCGSGMRDPRLDADRADLHARERAFEIAKQDPPRGVSSEAAAVAIAEVLDGIGDTCPECPAGD